MRKVQEWRENGVGSGMHITPAKMETLGLICQPNAWFQNPREMSTFLTKKYLLFNVATYTFVQCTVVCFEYMKVYSEHCTQNTNRQI